MIRPFALLLALALLTPALAQEARNACGGAGDPCTLPGGEYLAALPPGPASGAVIFLHGYGGRAEATIRNRALVAGLVEAGFAVIAPQGRPRFEGDRGGSWNSLGRPAPRRDDVAFLLAVADDAAGRFGLPREAMVLAGFSGGGMMTWQAACTAPEGFAAFAPVAGTFWRPAPDRCAGPIRLLHTHGTSDTVVPLAGRMVGSGITQGDLFEILATRILAADCPEDPIITRDGTTETRHWPACGDGSDIRLDLHPGGHVVPDLWGRRMLAWYVTVR